MKTLKVLAILLSYPEESVHTNTKDLAEVLKEENLLPKKTLKDLLVFLDDYKNEDFLELQERFVSTFDRSRNHCLNLFEHIHGESRDRGQAMVDLKDMYASKGLFINKKELPDYLPLFLEYLSLCDVEEAKESLGDSIDIIALIGGHLKKNKSPYKVIFIALEELSKIKVNKFRVAEAIENSPKEPETLDELDELWKEQEAFSGEASECNTCEDDASLN
ncbi:Respiratory nitrate reductase delta chain [uncultured Candidatus Thioglobus sp.]|jgi:nitrate reductase delta subunit|nr:Respiratory nitrate reductase delta chain (EC [Bathymodiolus brooksi thiotrophic gill symbiont]CAC9583457.1 Respiratory nitrate reductase delta chain (EC 1.7.99.4) [uncultured Gammaproteobacteria bacterium]SMN17216.1 Respiratory nitrate reductase delta chain [uncultured Candidatus Thioglobus sp.]CAC9618614.1 Respiratory nitrate reductase delta chain (EC 1.7.99.4) [uncultured Gammaproteobacteria bacterium]CAC9623290.1 Respiratory nitrate reductase delta chain (EC 1.7.99.4) [uncultured Gammapr